MQNATYYKDLGFRDKVQFYLVKAAVAVMTEAADYEHHEKRVEFSKQVLRNGVPLDTYALGVMTNSTIKAKIDAGESYDADLEFVVNSLFTAFAGGANE